MLVIIPIVRHNDSKPHYKTNILNETLIELNKVLQDQKSVKLSTIYNATRLLKQMKEKQHV